MLVLCELTLTLTTHEKRFDITPGNNFDTSMTCTVGRVFTHNERTVYLITIVYLMYLHTEHANLYEYNFDTMVYVHFLFIIYL